MKTEVKYLGNTEGELFTSWHYVPMQLQSAVAKVDTTWRWLTIILAVIQALPRKSMCTLSPNCFEKFPRLRWMRAWEERPSLSLLSAHYYRLLPHRIPPAYFDRRREERDGPSLARPHGAGTVRPSSPSQNLYHCALKMDSPLEPVSPSHWADRFSYICDSDLIPSTILKLFHRY